MKLKFRHLNFSKSRIYSSLCITINKDFTWVNRPCMWNCRSEKYIPEKERKKSVVVTGTLAGAALPYFIALNLIAARSYIAMFFIINDSHATI